MLMDRNTLFAWIATLILLVLCLFPKSGMPGVETSRVRVPHADKVVHFGMFAMFGFLWTRAAGARVAIAIRVFVAVVALAVGTELAQGLHFISRDPDVFDALADTLGGAAGIGAALFLAARSSAREALEPSA